MDDKRIKVVIEEYVIPHYRVPFFEKLSQYVDLTVIASQNKTVDGLKNSTDENLPFEVVLLRADPKAGLYHPQIFEVLRERSTDILISLSTSLDRMLTNKQALKTIQELDIGIMWSGCDGYAVRNFKANLLLNLFHPKRTLRTIKEVVAKYRIDHFLTYSSHTSQYLQKRLFVPRDKITIAHNAIDTSELRQEFLNWQSAGSKRYPYKIIFTGRLTPRKNINKLILAFKEISLKHQEATLEIIGEGSDLQNLQSLTEKLGLQQKINFVGPIYDDQALAQHLLSGSLFIMPSVGGLGFNTAMACALPIIFTHADGTEADLFEEGRNGWFFDGSVRDLVKKINLAFSKPGELLNMGLLSEKLVTEKFNLDNMVKSYLAAIRNVMNK